MCAKPIRVGAGFDVGCGQCMNCRINRVRQWVGRMLLEAVAHPFCSFVTLTYNDENLPKDRSVSKRDVQLFLKRLRKQLVGREIRYYAVGEYGDVNWRPHYHLIIYGLSATEKEVVEKCWRLGYISIGTGQGASMSYTGSYVLKKMTNPKDSRLEGRKPEFALMSQGIGKNFVRRVVETLGTDRGKAAFDSPLFNLNKIRTEGKKYPLGRYLREKIYAQVDIDGCKKREELWRIVDELAAETFQTTVSDIEAAKKKRRDVAIAVAKANSKIKMRLL